MSTPTRRARWLVPALLLLVWLGIGGALGPYAGKLGDVATNDRAAFLPQSAESTRVTDAQEAFQQDETLPVIVVWTADGGGSVTGHRAEATRSLASLAGTPGLVGRAARPPPPP
ncbi:hypothetical protein ACFWIR_08440, partial [Streptomyces olivaceus]